MPENNNRLIDPAYEEALNLTEDFKGNILYPRENFDPIKIEFPTYSPFIDVARKEGFRDPEIRHLLLEQERKMNFVAHPEEVNNFLGRTPETRKKMRAYETSQNFGIYRQLYPNKSDQEISDAIFLSTWQRGGVSAEALLSNPPLMEKIKGDLKISEGYWESAKRGANNWYITQKTGYLGARAMLTEISDEDALKEAKTVLEGQL